MPQFPGGDTRTQDEKDVARLLFKHKMLASPSDEELNKGINTALSFGPGVMKELRTPQKLALSKMVEAMKGDPALLESTIAEDFAKPTYRQWSKAINEEGRNGPYTVTAYRGGRGAVVPGRGRYYSPNPEFASQFVDPLKRGASAATHEEYVKRLKDLTAEELELRKPFVHQMSDGAPNYEPVDEVGDIIDKLGLGQRESRILMKLAKNHYYPDPATKFPPPAETSGKMVRESTMLQYEKYIARLAKDRGHDSVIKYSPESPWWELVKIDE